MIPVLKGLIGPLFGATLLLYQNQIRSPKPVEFEAPAPITRHATIIVASGMLGCLQSALQSRAQEKNCGDQTLLQKTSDGRWTRKILSKNQRMDILKRLCKSPSCESLSSNGCFLEVSPPPAAGSTQFSCLGESDPQLDRLIQN